MIDNLWGVGISTDGTSINIARLDVTLTYNEALNLAAWIAALADPLDSTFSELLKEARSE